ncbi:MAG: AraC family transcriptional regulator [Gammaproteobacteria bacterium]
MVDDALAPLLTHFSARARLFYTGTLCGHADFPDSSGLGYLHLLRAGTATLRDTSGNVARLDEPSLVFYTCPLTHSFDSGAGPGADLACASVSFDNASFNPVIRALPPLFQCRLADLSGSAVVLDALFAEASAEHPGRQQVLDRLFEVILIDLLRVAIRRDEGSVGFLRGLAHPKLARALTALHAHPEKDWSLEGMAALAGMSRSSFAAIFRREVGATPGDYLTRWRVAISQSLLRRGTPLQLLPERVGYGSQAGLLRAFKIVTGTTPMTWLRSSTFS